MIWFILLAAFVLLAAVLTLSLCKISGHHSRLEERREAMEQAGFVVCPNCKGVCGIETAPNDWHDCELCDATGRLAK